MNFKVLCNQIFVPKSVRRAQVTRALTENYKTDQNLRSFRIQLKHQMTKKGLSIRHPQANFYIKEDLYDCKNSLVNFKRANANCGEDDIAVIKQNNKMIKSLKEEFTKTIAKIGSIS